MKQTTIAKMQNDPNELIADTFIDLDMMPGARSPEELLKVVRNNSWTFKKEKATADLAGGSIVIKFKTGQRFEIPIEKDSGEYFIGRKVFTESKKKPIQQSLNENVYDEDYDSPYDLAYTTVQGPDSICYNPYSKGTSDYYEYRQGYEDAMRDNHWAPIYESRRRVNEAISRKQKERLNLLNDIVNFAYEYGENETKTLFQQAFKKAIGDDLIESLSDDE